MTGDERKEFVYSTVFGCETLNQAIDLIIAKWEDDVDGAFQRGQDVVHAQQIDALSKSLT